MTAGQQNARIGAQSAAAAAAPPVLELRDVVKHFPVTRGIVLRRAVGHIKAVDGISFAIGRGEVLGLVGESGCGKTTTARLVLNLLQPTAGEIRFEGEALSGLGRRGQTRFRRRVQAIFQDPYSSLNPRMRVREIVGEPLVIHRRGRRREVARRVDELLALCRLPRTVAERYPHEMSGGQRQRVGIARALALQPEFLVCDEPVSALDVSVQAQIINLLLELREKFNLTYLFIGHDLSVVKHLCDRVAVMYLGRIVETATSRELFGNPRHPYTQALLAAVPLPDPEAEAHRRHEILPGEAPSPLNPPAGCVFHPRCRLAVAACRERVPALRELRPGHFAACDVIDS